MRLTLVSIIVIAWAGLTAPAAGSDQFFSTRASHALIMDYDTGEVLYNKNAMTPMPPASMSKLMTVAVLFDAIEKGKITLDTEFYVSERAWRTGGSKMFVLVNTKISVRDLITGILVLSGNDACIVVAENMAASVPGAVNSEAELGDIADFVARMNALGAEWGLTQSRFANPTGLPDAQHRMSAYDLGQLARRLLRDYSTYEDFFKQEAFTWSDITQQNRNPLLGNFEGAMGMKTGHTDESGYGLVGAAFVNGERRIIVLNGLEDMPERTRESLRIMRLAFSEYERRNFFASGDRVGEVEVFMGKTPTLPVKVKNDIAFTLHKELSRATRASIVYTGPVRAPIAREQQVGMLRLEIPGRESLDYPLYAAERVREIGFFGKLSIGLEALLTPPSAHELQE